MKVLWLGSTPAGAAHMLDFDYPGANWISSLEAYFKKVPEIKLAVGFFYKKHPEFKFSYDSVTYYPIESGVLTLTGRINQKIFNRLDSNTEGIKKVIEDFKPDIIQLFGTETGLGDVVHLTDIPVIIHIQGLINPYLYAWFPKGINQTTLYLKSSLTDILAKKGILGNYYTFKKWAKREVNTISKGKYFFGRTEWDRRVIKIYNNNCKYFHCDELLRPAFFENQWHPNQASTLKFVTTVNPNIYKGIEIILETAFLLRKNTTLKFEWVVIGIEKNSQLVKLIEKIKKKKFKENFVSFIGPKAGNDVIRELLKADIFIHPSHIDNSPNSVCEAMLLGMPIIAGNVGGVSSLVQHNENGILYNSHDPFELAGIILEKKDKLSELKKLGDNARETAYKRHDPNTIVATLLSTYKQILSEKLYSLTGSGIDQSQEAG